MDSCGSCGAELGELQAFCAACGRPGTNREVSLDALLDGHSPTAADLVAPPGSSLADLVPWLPAKTGDEAPELDDDWDLSVPEGVPLRLVPLRDTEPEDAPSVEHPDDFWCPTEPDFDPEPEPTGEVEDELPVPVLPAPPPLPMTASAALAARVKSAETGVPLDEVSLTSEEASQIVPSAELDPWGVPISPVPLPDPSRPLFVDEAPEPETSQGPGLDVARRDMTYASLPRVGQLPYVAPRRSVPVSAVVAFVLAGVAGSAAIGLLAVPVANAETCTPDAVPASVAPQPAETTPSGPSVEEITTQLNDADVALSAAEAAATATEQKLAAARTALETATAATRIGGVDQSALTAAEAEVTRAASALQSAEAAQRSAASQASRHANAGDWELDMLRAAEKERDQFSKYDPSDPYWDNEVAKAQKAYEQALVPQRQAAAALTSANSAVATARSKHASAVSARNQVSGRNTEAVTRAEEQRKKAERQVARAEKAQAKAQSELVTAREARDELEAARRDFERTAPAPVGGSTPSTQADAAACDTAKRERRNAAGVAGGTSLALFAIGAGLTAKHRRR